MSLLARLLKESSAGGASTAGGIANSRGSLFSRQPKQSSPPVMIRRMGLIPVKDILKRKRKFSALKEALDGVGANKYDYQDTLSKLDQAVRTAATPNEDVAVFGLEDDEGKLIKVYVKKEQAKEFESALAGMLADTDTLFGDDIEPQTATELAEVLYILKDKFDIVDVEWGTIQGDEEEEGDTNELPGSDDAEGVEGDAGAEGDVEGDADGVEGDAGAEGDVEGDAVPADGSEETAGSALQAVIAMMRADAEAKTAEAKARTKEAEARIAGSAADAAAEKVKQEEEILDMEEYEKSQKDAKKEAERLAKLAKYKKDMESDSVEDATDGLPLTPPLATPENEESSLKNAISKEQLAKLILRHASRGKGI